MNTGMMVKPASWQEPLRHFFSSFFIFFYFLALPEIRRNNSLGKEQHFMRSFCFRSGKKSDLKLADYSSTSH